MLRATSSIVLTRKYWSAGFHSTRATLEFRSSHSTKSSRRRIWRKPARMMVPQCQKSSVSTAIRASFGYLLGTSPTNCPTWTTAKSRQQLPLRHQSLRKTTRALLWRPLRSVAVVSYPKPPLSPHLISWQIIRKRFSLSRSRRYHQESPLLTRPPRHWIFAHHTSSRDSAW